MNRINLNYKNIAFVTAVIFMAVMALFLSIKTAEACTHNCGYPNYQQPQSPLGVSCYSSPTTGRIGDNITWTASPYGGTGNYYITWSGNDGLSGYGTSILKSYNNAGSKYASVTVTSGGQTATANCGNNVIIYDNYNNNYNNNYPYNGNYYYNYPNYNYNYTYPNYNYNYNTPIYASCNANTSFSNVGSSVVWSATASGGSGYYTYNWYGTDNINGYGQTAYVTYNYPGIKTAYVTITSGNQTTTQYCSNSVNVSGQIYNNNYNNNSNSLQIACYADKTSARVNTPVTWAVETVGGTGNYTYSWTGTDGLSSTQSSVIKTYDSTGAKTASVTVTASNGQTSTQSCGNLVTITRTSTINGNTNTVRPTPIQNVSNDNDQSAAALFSLKNVPWGLVAIFIILIMFAIIVYLVYNRNKV
jgi:hypothetical protein